MNIFFYGDSIAMIKTAAFQASDFEFVQAKCFIHVTFLTKFT